MEAFSLFHGVRILINIIHNTLFFCIILLINVLCKFVPAGGSLTESGPRVRIPAEINNRKVFVIPAESCYHFHKYQ